VLPVKPLKVRLSPQGRLDYFSVLNTLLEQRRGREDLFMNEFEKASANLELFPEMGIDMSILGPGIRRTFVWDYHVFYRAADSEIVVERIIHGARDIEAAFFDE
jgi:plasmid stabilization system protein ParE